MYNDGISQIFSRTHLCLVQVIQNRGGLSRGITNHRKLDFAVAMKEIFAANLFTNSQSGHSPGDVAILNVPEDSQRWQDLVTTLRWHFLILTALRMLLLQAASYGLGSISDQQHSQQRTASLTATMARTEQSGQTGRKRLGQLYPGPWAGGGGVPHYLKNQDKKMATVFANHAIYASFEFNSF
jgi:hypothetical protein